METTTKLNLKCLSDSALTDSLTAMVRRERRITADVVEHISEFTKRRLYLDHGCTSIFGYLTTKLGYSGATAQNRIDAARLLEVAPGLDEAIANGSLNLTQVSVLAQGLRQRAKESPESEFSAEQTQAVLNKIKDCDVKTSAVIIAQELDLELKETEKLRPQKDESVRLEMTLTKEQFEALRRAKDLASHVQHDASWADVVSILTNEYLKRKDPTVEKPVRKSKAAETAEPPQATANSDDHFRATAVTTSAETAPGVKAFVSTAATGKFTSDPNKKSRKRTHIPVATKREVAKRGGGCQEIVGENGERCGSTFQTQFDHIVSVYQGGGNEPENLQVLCGIHNRLKYAQGR